MGLRLVCQTVVETYTVNISVQEKSKKCNKNVEKWQVQV